MIEEKEITKYINIVKTIAKQYKNIAQTYTIDDLEQIGYLGLLEAFTTYDETKASFCTFAYQKIKYAILDALTQTDRIVYVPESAQSMVKQFRKEHKENHLSLEEFCKKYHCRRFYLQQALLAMQPILYLEAPFVYKTDEMISLLELLIEDKDIINGPILCQEVRDSLSHFLFQAMENNIISSKEMDILNQYFGINEEAISQTEIAKKYQISKSRIGAIIHKAVRKLQSQCPKELLETCEEYDLLDYQ